jgi:Rap1a immunity proteins
LADGLARKSPHPALKLLKDQRGFITRCWFYLAAIQDLTPMVDKAGKRVLGICPPENVRLTQLIRVFVAYSQRTPGRLHEPASKIALEAWVEAFPCG